VLFLKSFREHLGGVTPLGPQRNTRPRKNTWSFNRGPWTTQISLEGRRKAMSNVARISQKVSSFENVTIESRNNVWSKIEGEFF
jgi:hypothetical protein